MCGYDNLLSPPAGRETRVGRQFEEALFISKIFTDLTWCRFNFFELVLICNNCN